MAGIKVSFKQAFEFARNAHSTQLRKGIKTPYIEHPLKVAEMVLSVLSSKDKKLAESEAGKAMIEAALLHDTIEDTAVTYGQISELFGKTVADLVLELSSDKNECRVLEAKIGKMEGKARYLSEKMAKMSSNALLIKLADRLHNIQDAKKSSPEFNERYLAQTKIIVKNIKDRISHEREPHRILFKELLAELE